ncbi:MAG: TldD/PmbA family protein [Bacteroidales bacterium]
MISSDHKNTARWAMDYALKNGCQNARVIISSGSNNTFEVLNTKLDRLNQASENSMEIELFVDGRYGSFSTNRINKKELEAFIKNGIASTRFLAEDPARTLPDSSTYYKGGMPDLGNQDPRFEGIDADEKIALAHAITAEIYDTDERLISVNGSYRDGTSDTYMIASNGFEGEKGTTFFVLRGSASIKGEGEARPSDGWSEVSLIYDELPKTDIGKKALERVIRKLGQKKAPSGKYTMVVDQLNSSQLMGPMLQSLYGSALQQKNSFLIDKLGQKVASDKLTLIDDPHLPKSNGARYFDWEGVKTERRPVFENGVLKTYYIDTYYGNKMQVKPTVSSPSILTMPGGTKDLQQLISGVNKGILVTGFNGGNSNSTTGDFSYGIEGFLIENGVLTQPVSEMNVTGNMLTLWSNLSEIGNDARLSSTRRIPSLVFEEVNFSGL